MAIRVIKYDPAATFNGIARVAVAEGDICGLNSAGTVEKADADATHGATATNRAWGFAVKAAVAGAMVALAPIATIDGYSGMTPGAPQYVSTTAGSITETKPVTNTFTQQIIGVARTATELLGHVMLPLTWQTSGSTTVNSL